MEGGAEGAHKIRDVGERFVVKGAHIKDAVLEGGLILAVAQRIRAELVHLCIVAPHVCAWTVRLDRARFERILIELAR